MAEPMERSDSVQAFLNRLTGQDNQVAIRQDKCVLCGKVAKDFKDVESREEFCISGLCQACQDMAFTEEDDDEPPY